MEITGQIVRKMHNRLLVALATSALVLSSCASVVTYPDWQFVQSVGGLSIGELEMVDGVYYLPVNMSVASYKRGTKAEMVCVASHTVVAGKQIFLSVKTDSRANAPRASAECPKARVGGIPDGNYRVMYRDADGNSTKVGDVVADLANAPVGTL